MRSRPSHASVHGRRSPRWTAFALAALLGTAGCAGDPTAPDAHDVAGGGAERVLDYELFLARVAPVLAAEGCDAGGACHGGGIRGTFALSPAADKDPRFDFEQAAQQVDALLPERSALLLKPLAEAAGGAPHGHTAFEDVDDAGYRSILEWIEDGELRR